MSLCAEPVSFSFDVAGERIDLLPDRAAFWPARQTLIIADLHLGKCETLRAAGMPIPIGVIERDLARLAAAATRCAARRILVVGDLLHHPTGLTPDLINFVAAFRNQHLAQIELALVRGNHDRRVDTVAKQWGITSLSDSYLEAPFGFAHDPADGLVNGAGFTWFGHLHPLCDVGGVTIPCFRIDTDHALLPAFSLFTRGVALPHSVTATTYGIAENRVVPIPCVRPFRPSRKPVA